ncbi:MAG: T9SS type A sorting domain-containing protein [bacterium]|nr:MAG: T9SS type A sorting domain-containing protein [bacterium]
MKLFTNSKSFFFWKEMSQLLGFQDRASFFVMVFFVLIIGAASPLFSQLEWTKDPANPLPLNGASGTWNSNVFAPCVLYNPDSSRYEMWFGAGFNHLRPYRIGFATSPDAINWNYIHPTPVLEPTPGSWDEFTVEFPMVLREKMADSIIYKMWYCTGSSFYDLQIGYATSPNGIDWTKYLVSVMGPGTEPWEAGGPEVGYVLRDSVAGVYRMWYTGYNQQFTASGFGYAESVDGLTWQRPYNYPLLTLGSLGEWDDRYIWFPRVFIINNMYYMLYTGEHSSGNPQPRRIGLATSPDGISWTKYDNSTTTNPPYAESDPVLSPSPGQWDQHFVGAGSTLLIDSTLHTWYNGSTHPTNTYLWRIGHATLPGDSLLVGIKKYDNSYISKGYFLQQNYPNPFNPTTTIEFDLAKTSEVSLKVFNILGEEVFTLVSDRLSAGSYSYDWDASNLASGVYLYRLQAGDYVETRKMVLMR